MLGVARCEARSRHLGCGTEGAQRTRGGFRRFSAAPHGPFVRGPALPVFTRWFCGGSSTGEPRNGPAHTRRPVPFGFTVGHCACASHSPQAVRCSPFPGGSEGLCGAGPRNLNNRPRVAGARRRLLPLCWLRGGPRRGRAALHGGPAADSGPAGCLRLVTKKRTHCSTDLVL